MITRTTGCPGQQHARSSRQTDESGRMSSWGGAPDSGAALSAPVYGNLGFMGQASTGGVLASRDVLPGLVGRRAPADGTAAGSRLETSIPPVHVPDQPDHHGDELPVLRCFRVAGEDLCHMPGIGELAILAAVPPGAS